jgi:hypothetical protein
MEFFKAFDQTKPRPELIMMRVRVIADDLKAAALPRALRPECADNDVTSAFYRTCNVLNVNPWETLRMIRLHCIAPAMQAKLRQTKLCDMFRFRHRLGRVRRMETFQVSLHPNRALKFQAIREREATREETHKPRRNEVSRTKYLTRAALIVQVPA